MTMKHAATFLLIPLVAGCAQMFGQLDPGYRVTPAGDTVFVMGVEPANYKVVLWPGNVDQDLFVIEDMWKNAAHLDAPRNGYVVGNANPNDHVGVKEVWLMSEDGKRVTMSHRYCQGRKTPVFATTAGKVVYLGDYRFAVKDGLITYEYTRNLEKARAFVDANYPKLTGLLEDVEVREIFSTIPCLDPAQPMVIPVIIPSG